MAKGSLKTSSPQGHASPGDTCLEDGKGTPSVEFVHVPVLCAEVLGFLSEVPSGLVIDCTAGGGGHSNALLAARSDIQVLALDRDPDAVNAAQRQLAVHGARASVVHQPFSELGAVLQGLGIGRVSGVLADLGVSSHHLDVAHRGFSFQHDGPLDMRMDPSSGLPLRERLASVSANELADVLYYYGDIRASRRTAAAVLQAWRDGCASTADLAAHLKECLPRGGKTHPATRVFQALRMWVNDEMGQLEALLALAPTLLVEGGVMAVISFHSGEDRVVKHHFRSLSRSRDADYERLSKKPVTASRQELSRNPRARSAKLRGLRRKAN